MGLGASKPKSTFDFHPEDYYGTWLEVGRYADPQESVCNDVRLDIAPSGTGFKVLKTCGCFTNKDTICGKPEYIEYNRVDDSNTYETIDPKTQQKGTATIIWTNYTGWSLVGDGDRLWIYQRPKQNITSEDLARLFVLILRNGYDPTRVILTGRTIQQLAAQRVYTGTLVAPFCSSPEGVKFGLNDVCPKVPKV
jgi:lipocalin